MLLLLEYPNDHDDLDDLDEDYAELEVDQLLGIDGDYYGMLRVRYMKDGEERSVQAGSVQSLDMAEAV